MRKTTKIYEDIPAGYPLCMHADCPKADSCLRQLAFRRHAHYVSNQPVKFAKGFTNFQKRMYPDQYDKFMTTLVCHFGRNQYFKRRRGDIVLSPEEQEEIKAVLEKVGVNHPMEFDQYIEAINWIP